MLLLKNLVYYSNFDIMIKKMIEKKTIPTQDQENQPDYNQQ